MLDLSASRVVRNLEFTDIDWEDPLNSSLEYRAGFNGGAELAFSILGIGLFSYHLADMSATLDVGLDRQHFALQGVYEPTETGQPVWLPLRPSPEPNHKIVANIFADGAGDFAMELRGEFHSSFPEATISGSMRQTLEGLTLTGLIDDDTNPIRLRARTDGSTFNATIDYHVDVNKGLKSQVLAELDRNLNEIRDAFNQLKQATSDYELELSLRGLRSALPRIADAGILIFNKIPDEVAGRVKSRFVSFVKNYCLKVFGVCTNPLDLVIDENRVGNTIAASARSKAQAAIKPYVNALREIKAQAGEADSATLRETLRLALLEAYNHRIFSKKFTVSYKFPAGVGSKTFYDKTITKTVIPSALATQIKTAADNVHNITETSDLKISAQQFLDALPVEEAISQAKQDVEGGLAQVPSFDGAGYSVSIDSNPSAYVVLSGKKHEVDFNLLSPADVIANILDLISGELIASE